MRKTKKEKGKMLNRNTGRKLATVETQVYRTHNKPLTLQVYVICA